MRGPLPARSGGQQPDRPRAPRPCLHPGRRVDPPSRPTPAPAARHSPARQPARLTDRDGAADEGAEPADMNATGDTCRSASATRPPPTSPHPPRTHSSPRGRPELAEVGGPPLGPAHSSGQETRAARPGPSCCGPRRLATEGLPTASMKGSANTFQARDSRATVWRGPADSKKETAHGHCGTVGHAAGQAGKGR